MRGILILPVLAAAPLAAQNTDNPYASLVPTLVGSAPANPVPPPGLGVPDQQPFFDAFSWQSFIALCWPADLNAGRGKSVSPNSPGLFRETNTGKGPCVPVVWTTFRTAEELFPLSGDPPEWSAPGRWNPAFHVNMMQKIAPGTAALNEAFGGPLIDQHGHYTLYQVLFNQAYYVTVANKQWYKPSVLQTDIGSTGITFPLGCMEFKASWRPMVDGDDASRYYTIEATTPQSGGKTVTLGLVGFHIAVKTSTRPQWLWSTFEQVDNVTATAPVKASYNSGQPLNPGFNYQPQSVPPKAGPPVGTPVEVNRLTPIISTVPNSQYSTAGLNAAYQKLLQGTVWAHYQLIATQWPTDPGASSGYDPSFDPSNYTPAVAGKPFPRFVANTTMETYFQGNDPDVTKSGNTSNSCLQCHYHAQALGCDFSWALVNRSLNKLPSSK